MHSMSTKFADLNSAELQRGHLQEVESTGTRVSQRVA